MASIWYSSPLNGASHPNLAKAQELVDKAYQYIEAAQGANGWDMAGHGS